jgi:hypothetical protein
MLVGYGKNPPNPPYRINAILMANWNEKFIEDAERFRRQPEIVKKIAKTLSLLERNPLQPGLHLERIVNDPTAWAVRVDQRYRRRKFCRRETRTGRRRFDSCASSTMTISIAIPAERRRRPGK